MILSVASAFGILVLLAGQSVASPAPAGGIKIGLNKQYINRDADETQADLAWVQASTNQLAAKYHATLTAFEDNTGSALPGTDAASRRRNLAKRQSEGLTDEQGGSFWQGQISIGTPAQTFNM